MTEFSKGIYVQIKFNSFYHRDIKLRANGPNNYQHCWPDKVRTCCVRVGSCLQADAKTPNRDITLRANGPSNSQHCWPNNVGTWCVCLREVVERLTVFKLCATTPNNTPIRATGCGNRRKMQHPTMLTVVGQAGYLTHLGSPTTM